MKDFKVFASCHNHSTFSDGENSPEMLVRTAKCMGHGGIILTDHDTIAGYPFIKKAAEDTGLLTMLGCEFTTYHTTGEGKSVGVHLLGFDFDPENDEIKKFINWGSGIQTERSHLLFDWALERGLYRLGGSDHENVLGGLLSFGERYASPYEFSGIDKERFMELYERKLG